MPTSTLRNLVCTTLVLGATACGSDNEEFTPAPPFDKSEDVAIWATASSAVGVYSHVNEPIAVADGQQTFATADCPAVEDDGTTWTATGGCTTTADDGSTIEWTGTATIVRDGADLALTLDDYNGDNGTLSLREVEPGRHEFEAQLDIGGFTTIDYMGSVQGGYGERTLWNGSGTVKRDGFFAPNGEVEATTLDEVVDNDLCAGQPVSGTTTLKSGDDTAVITYDGETDCDEDAKAAVAVNDEDRGLVAGINCSVAAPGGRAGNVAAGLALLLAAAAAAQRSRRAARRRP